MTDGQGRWLIFNGEIFNFIELRAELEKLGDVFQTATDTEVILHIYARFGVSGFAKLNGMWAFALVDLPQRKIILSRDRFSIKPLYYTRQNGRVYFSSEIKQLLPLLPSRNLNRNIMSAFLSQQLLDHTPETFFEGVQRVPAKSSLTISFDTSEISFHQYWNYHVEFTSDLETSIDEFRTLLDDSVRIRLRSDVKVGCMLSGGLDSSAIATICHGMGAQNIETFSVVSDDARYSEEKFIDIVNASTGVKNHKLCFNSTGVIPLLEQVLRHSDEPVAGFSVVAQYSIFQLIKQETDVTVLLSGQGGDEILLGYFKFFFLYLKNLVRKGDLLTAVTESLASLIRGTVLHQFRLSEAKRYIPWLNSQLYGDALYQNFSYVPAPIWLGTDLRRRQIEDIDLYSVPALAHYEDRNSMAHSLEVRHPFLDHRLVDYALNLRSDYKIHNGWNKYILRKSFPDLPPAVRWRKDKQGFITAEAKWIREDLQPVIRKVFRNSYLQQLGILDERKFLLYYEDFLNGKSVDFQNISRALIAELWARQALYSPSSEPVISATAQIMAESFHA